MERMASRYEEAEINRSESLDDKESEDRQTEHVVSLSFKKKSTLILCTHELPMNVFLFFPFRVLLWYYSIIILNSLLSWANIRSGGFLLYSCMNVYESKTWISFLATSSLETIQAVEEKEMEFSGCWCHTTRTAASDTIPRTLPTLKVKSTLD